MKNNAGGGSKADDLFDLAAVSDGAHFHRVDLHIHVHGTSGDVRDTKMTVAAIINRARQSGLRMIAITDHNTIAAAETAVGVDQGSEEAVVVVPGIEISTAAGHVLALYAPDNVEALRRLLPQLDFQKTGGGDLHTRMRIEEVAAIVASGGGICIPAHIDRAGTGFEVKATFRDREAILNSADIAALEIDDASNLGWYSPTDAGPNASERLKLLKGRIEELGSFAGSRLPKVQFSDAHELATIGKNRVTGAEKVTRVKMEQVSFEGLRVALLDPDARLRVEAELRKPYPALVAARFVGGFLDGQQLGFSPSLNCLIGGRGTGKSTALDAIHWACGEDVSAELQEKDNWPDSVELCFDDEFGQRHWMKRESGQAPVEWREQRWVESGFAVEGYEQDRTALIVRAYEDDPGELGNFLDQFIDLEAEFNELATLRQALTDNADEIMPLRSLPKDLADTRKEAAQVQAKIAAANKSNLQEILRWRRMLLSERRLRELLLRRVEDLAATLQNLDVSIDLGKLGVEAGAEDLDKTISHELLTGPATPNVSGLVAEFAAAVANWAQEGRAHREALSEALKPLFEKWASREEEIQKRSDDAIAKLRALGIEPDLKGLSELSTTEDRLRRRIGELEAMQFRLTAAESKRKGVLARYRQVQRERYQKRLANGRSMTQQLKASAARFEVSIKYVEGFVVDAYDAWMRRALDKRFVSGPRIAQLCRAIHPIDLASMARNDRWSAAAKLSDAGQVFLDNTGEAQRFLAQLRTCDLFELEAIAVDDRPVITLTVRNQGGVQTARFENLSFGQKSSILLGILLFSEARAPLLIDQPEDHLDSQFIFETVVQTLRRIKERRQVIVATHNANIAILGDAELIVPLTAWKAQGKIVDRGSVDTAATRTRACRVLEGGEVAYRRRGELYGLT